MAEEEREAGINKEEDETCSKAGVKRPKVYNKPTRRQALLEIRRLLVDEGLSHNEIQLRLNIPSSTYFTWLDMLFREEQQAICGNNYTYQRLLNETLILNQRYLRHARQLTAIAEDKNVDAEQRIAAIEMACHLERAVHDMAYYSPSYLRTQGLLPHLPPHSNSDLSLAMSHVGKKSDKDKEHYQYQNPVFESAGEYRKKNILKDPEVSEEAKEEIRQELEEQQVREENKVWEELVKRAKANNRTISPTPPEQWRAQYRRQKQQ